MSIVIIGILIVVIFCCANDARMSKLAWIMADKRIEERDHRIRALEAQLRAHLLPAEITASEEQEAELDKLEARFSKGAF